MCCLGSWTWSLKTICMCTCNPGKPQIVVHNAKSILFVDFSWIYVLSCNLRPFTSLNGYLRPCMVLHMLQYDIINAIFAWFSIYNFMLFTCIYGEHESNMQKHIYPYRCISIYIHICISVSCKHQQTPTCTISKHTCDMCKSICTYVSWQSCTPLTFIFP